MDKNIFLMKIKYFIRTTAVLFLFLNQQALFPQWNSTGSITTKNITDIRFPASNNILYCTAWEPYPGTVSGQLIKSDNNGATWYIICEENTKKFAKIFFPDLNTGYARILPYESYTYKNNFCKTTNGGVNWVQLLYDSPVNDFYFINPLTGWCAGASYVSAVYTAKIYRTTNGGNSWTITTPGNYSLCGIQFLDSNTGYATGTIYHFYNSTFKSIVLKTSDGGLSWNFKDSSYPNLIYSLSFANQYTGYVAGAGGLIIKTTNGGDNWFSVSSGTGEDIKSIQFVTPDRGWFMTGAGKIFCSMNSGSNWLNQYANSSGYSMNILRMESVYRGRAGGQNGVMLSTTNGGATFINENGNNQDFGYSLSQNYPNPFNNGTVFSFFLPEQANVKLVIYNMQGKETARIVDNEFLCVGTHTRTFNFGRYPGGVYLYALYADSRRILARKMILLK